MLWLNKEREADVLDRVIRRHEGPIRSATGLGGPSGGVGRDRRDGLRRLGSPCEVCRKPTSPPSIHFWHLGICGMPPRVPDRGGGHGAERLAADYVALFPIYKTVVDVLHGEEDRFPALFGQFEDWLRGQTEGLALVEGGLSWSYRQHRGREKRLRKEKIREALARGGGRLRCEVPGCGSDFFEVYGEVGRISPTSTTLNPSGGVRM